MKKLLLPVLLLLLSALSSCRVFYPDLMFKTDPEFQFAKPDSADVKDYVVRPGDELSISILSNNGYQLIDVLGTTGTFVPINYVVKSTGYSSLPLLDSVLLSGYTLHQLQRSLENRYSYYFLHPYVRIKVLNSRVTVFTGRSAGRVLDIEDERISLTEAIGRAGGLVSNKAYRIKVLRGDPKNPKVYLFDLSTIEGYRHADFLVTNGDIIYVEPSLTLADVNEKILPILTTISTLLLIYTALNSFGTTQ